jgi:CDP-6-deoxy-D-xylo-4-hexulose-3-dehydrase
MKISKNFSHPLMENNITKPDLEKVITFLKKKNILLTQGSNVFDFEKKWSKWLGVKYSTFVNSGSSANLISMSILKIMSKNDRNEIIVPSLTWSSDISSVILNNFKPIFTDICLDNLSMNEDQIYKSINKKTLAVFLTHAQGFNGLSDHLLFFLKKKGITLIEDVCESHGATFKEKKLGSFGLISNFSFYFAHHLSTIEGGMVCTNDKKIYQLSRILRSHGMAREIGNIRDENKIISRYPKLSPKFIFLYPGYNFRNTEIGAVIGLNQLKRLDKNNKLRTKNFLFFLNNLNQKNYHVNFNFEGSSNYAFPLILKKKNFSNRKILEKTLNKYNIEFRRGNAGGGNQLRQPYLKNYVKGINMKNYPNVDHVHFFGYYIGNYPTLTKKKIFALCQILNSIKYV